MSKINVLDEKTASKIAAGEVIERPSGVLKELLENSVDAGATAIHVDLEDAGKGLIRVNDNGCGMEADDLAASVLRHATSKIKNFEDLDQLQTFGFRGEALYSVAAVSNMTIASCPEGKYGSKIEIHAGKVLAQSPAPALQGTTVEIRDLFFNTPARLKFLKSNAYERACLLKVVEESALANVNVAYYVNVNGKEMYRLPAQEGDFKTAVMARAKDILGEEVGASLQARSFKDMGLQLFVTPVDKLVSMRDFQFVFVNRRPLESKTVQQAVYKAFLNVRPKEKHPAFLVYLELDPASFDVNIHPQKRDIRFMQENDVFSYILNSTSETVFGNSKPIDAAAGFKPKMAVTAQAACSGAGLFTPSVKIMPGQPVTYAEPSGSEPLAVAQAPKTDFAFKPAFIAKETEERAIYTAVSPAPAPEPELVAAELPDPNAPSWWQGPYHYLGQLQKSYLIFENPQGLVLIDQHAAQERVLYEKYLDAFVKHSLSVQDLIFPIHVDLPPSNAERLMSWADWLKSAGFAVSRFAANTVLLSSVPNVFRFKEDEMKEFVISLAQIVGDPDKSTEDLKRKMVAMLACKRAIKAHDQISASEAEGLLLNMKKCQDGMHCPHGRPSIAQLSIKDVAKLFGR